MLKRACEYIEDDVPGSLDLDYNSDGYVDNMVFTVKGATTAWGTLLWPHRWALYLETVFIHGKRVWDYNLQIEQHLNNSGAGVLCHEMFHSLSAPDLYHYNTSPYSSVGPWDLMDQANNPPQSMGAYMKYRYGGWINSIPEITECGTYTLNPLSESANNCFRIASPNSSTQYFVLEYRVKEGVFEGGIPGSGLVVYRIDHTLNGQGNAQGPPDEVYVYRPDGSLTNNGDLGQAHFAADYGRTEINDNTNPNPFLQNGQPGGLNISNVGYAGETITFDVWFEKAPVASFSSSETLVTPGCAVDFYDESLCEVDSWNWTFDGGNPSSSTEQFPTGIVWDTPGTFSVALTVTNTWGTDTKTESTFIVVDDNATPVVEFFASDSVICTNTILSVSDFSSVCPEGWNWEISPGSYGFVNGTGASSQHIDLVLLEPVSYTISLTATNANGSSTITKENYLTAGGLSELYEDFEGEDPFSRGWTVMNEDEDITWEIYNTEGNGSEQAAGINLFNYTSIFARDQLISPPVNLSNATQATLFFEHAYAQSLNTTYTDSLIVKISTDCGQNWETIAELGEDGSYNFATHEPSGFSFIPESSMDWCNGGMYATCQTIDISAYAGNPDTRIMFESVRLTGNNLFIDNVGIESTVGYTGNMVKQSSSFRLSQNPARDFVDIIMTTGHDYSRVVIYNTQGIPVAEKTLETGTTRQKIDLHGYLPGLYFIGLRSGNDLEVKKLIIR